MTVLSHQTIIARCTGHQPPLVSPYHQNQVRTAGYDLTLGYEYYFDTSGRPGGAVKTYRLGGDAKVLEIAANQVVLVTTTEEVFMPADLVGHLSLKLDILLDGIIMASQSQIDAGYKGPIYVLLYNLSDTPTILSLGQALLRLEFEETDQPTEHPYDGDYKPNFTLGDVIRTPIVSSMASLRTDFVQLEERSQRRLRVSIIAAASALIAGLAVVATFITPFMQDASTSKADSDSQSRQISQLQESVHDLNAQLTLLLLQATTTTTTTPSNGPGS